MQNPSVKNALILAGLAGLFFLVGGTVLSLTNPDETFYTQTAREMAHRGEWMTPYLFDHPQFEKPILLYWLLRIAFIPFGITSFAARLFPAIFGVLGVLAVYRLAAVGFQDEKKAFGAGAVLMSGALYAGMAKTVFTDMIFSVLILCSLMFFFLAYSQTLSRRTGTLLFFVSSALAVLAKGPLGVFIPIMAIVAFLLIRKNVKYLLSRDTLWGIMLFLLIAVPWYALMFAKYGRGFTDEFFINDHWRRFLEAEHPHNDTWFYYPLCMIGGMFPWSLFVAAALVAFVGRLRSRAGSLHVFLACWIGAVLLAFQFAHSKLPSYILPVFPALALLTADFIWDDKQSPRTSRLLHILSILTTVLFVLLSAGLCVAAVWYSRCVAPIASLCFMAAFLVLAFSLLLLIAVARRRWSAGRSIWMFAAVLFVLAPLPFLRYVEPFVSSRLAGEFLKTQDTSKSALLCAKPFVRGTLYYTGRPVVVMAIDTGDFFSPHPIPFLNTVDKVKDFLKTQPTTYAFLTESQAEHFQDTLGAEFVCTRLKALGDEHIVRITSVCPACSH